MESERFLQSTLGAMDLIYNIARRVVPRGDDVDDLVQETYLAAFRAWTEGRRPRKVEPWLATICLNLARSGYRRRSRRPLEVPLDEAAEAVDRSSDTETEALAMMERGLVHEALWSLPEGQRVAIALVDLAGLSPGEAAQVMGTPRGTVLSRLHRGRRSLALLVRDRIGEREP
jgi:RNA polymerase sigma-70 factor (ECF subfamily)